MSACHRITTLAAWAVSTALDDDDLQVMQRAARIPVHAACRPRGVPPAHLSRPDPPRSDSGEALRDRYANTALHVWKYTEEVLLQQGSWKDPETVRRFYSGITDQTLAQAMAIHGWGGTDA